MKREEREKALQDELVVAKKKKLKMESVARRLFDNADKRSKEVAKKSAAAKMKALVVESNTLREKSAGNSKERYSGSSQGNS